MAARPTRVLTDADVRRVFEWSDAVRALRAAYSSSDDAKRFPARTMARGDGVWLRTLSGVSADGKLMGAKLIAASPRAQRASYLVALFDQASTELVALLDGNAITGFRTAATSALAADCLARTGALTVGIIGSGFEAKNHLRALAAVRELRSVRVYSPRAESRQRFIVELSDLGLDITSANDARTAVDGADVVVCAARSRDESPTLYADGLAVGATVLSIGSTLPEQREVDVSVIAASKLIVSDMMEEVSHDTGDMLAAATADIPFSRKMISLAAVVSGQHVGRQSHTELILYKSVGAWIQDLAVAAACLARATEQGIGLVSAPIVIPVDKGKS